MLTQIFFLKKVIIALFIVVFFLCSYIMYFSFLVDQEDSVYKQDKMALVDARDKMEAERDKILVERNKIRFENARLVELLEAKPASTLDLLFSILLLIFLILVIIAPFTYYSLIIIKGVMS